MSSPARPQRRLKKRYLALIIVAVVAAMLCWLALRPARIPAGTFLVLALDAPPPERPPEWSASLFARPPLDLLALWNSLRHAATDPSVDGLVVRIGPGAVRLGMADELRDLVGSFRQSGKVTVAEVSAPDTLGYYVASAAQTLRLDRTTTADTVGLRLSMFFLKEALAEWGIEADLVRVGSYKGAFEQMALSGPTPALETSLEELLDSLHGTIVDAVAVSRGLEPAVVRAHFDRAPLPADEALAAKLVDELKTVDDTRARLEARQGRAVHLVSAREYAASLRPRSGGRAIGVIHVLGAIAEGESQHLPLVGDACGVEDAARALRDAAGDESIAGILLRIDSPGGAASAAEKLCLAVESARKSKPVVASMGATAASGGYFAACSADHIFAHPTTLTGSIGIFGGKVVVEDLLARHKVGTRAYARGQHATMSDMTRRYTPDERIALKAVLEGAYRRFVDLVAAGRKRSFEEIDAVAQGRLWSGKAAVACGLVDRLGGLDDAFVKVCELARLEPTAAVEAVLFPPPATLWESLGIAGGKERDLSASPAGLDVTVPSAMEAWRGLERAGFLGGASPLALMPLAIDVR